jgi:hypothetical protein
MSTIKKRTLPLRSVLAFALVVTLFGYACVRPAPFVSNPREEWEDAAERGMLRIQPQTPTPRPLEPSDEEAVGESPAETHNQAEEVLAGIIGFPFRAVAWIAHVVF